MQNVQLVTGKVTYPHIEQIKCNTPPDASLGGRVTKFVTAACPDLQRCIAMESLGRLSVGISMLMH
jgi:hypothetical protein